MFTVEYIFYMYIAEWQKYGINWWTKELVLLWCFIVEKELEQNSEKHNGGN